MDKKSENKIFNFPGVGVGVGTFFKMFWGVGGLYASLFLSYFAGFLSRSTSLQFPFLKIR